MANEGRNTSTKELSRPLTFKEEQEREERIQRELMRRKPRKPFTQSQK